MAKEDLYMVRRHFPFYGDLYADTGAVFPLAGFVNDEKLIRLGFLEKVTGKPFLATCGICGQQFLSGQYRDAHGDRRHHDERIQAGAGHPLDGAVGGYSLTGIEGTMVPDLTGDAEERRLEREAPIYWEKTAASQKG